MVEPRTAPTTPARLARWPTVVRDDLARRAEQVAASATGRVLDLDEPAARALVARRGAPGAAADDTGYDMIVSIAALIEFADLPGAVRGMRSLLAPGGHVVFVEPVVRPGWRGIVGASAGALIPAVRGRHVGRDIPLALRSNGFVITDIERYHMPTPIWPLRAFVHGRAIVDPGVLR